MRHNDERDENIHINTSTADPYQVLHDLLEGTGFQPADYADDSNAEIAQAMADIYAEWGVKLIDDLDDEVMDIAKYVERYLERKKIFWGE